jgi:hypothetical protein
MASGAKNPSASSRADWFEGASVSFVAMSREASLPANTSV